MNNKIWTDSIKNFIVNNADSLTDKELAEYISKMIGRTVTMEATRKQRQKLKVSKEPGRGVCKVKQGKKLVGLGVNKNGKF